MVLILHRYIFRELFKVFVLASIGLTLILSLGSILHPVQEYGVGPAAVLRLIGCFIPITLTFILPMAALFASALVYGRFASDNELDACKASGVSLLTLVYPGLTLAIVVAIANLILSFHMLPYFVHVAEKSLQGNAKLILFRNIQRKGYYKVPSDDPWLIYADQVSMETDTLIGVVVAHVKKNTNSIETIFAAERATVKFNSQGTSNEVRISASKIFKIGAEDESGFSIEQGAIATEFGSLLDDSIKFKKINQMKEIRADLMRFRPIEIDARDTYAQFTTELLAQEILEKMARDPNAYYSLYNSEKLVEFRADTIVVGDEKIRLEGNILVLKSGTDGRMRTRIQPAKASLHIEGNKLAPTITMDLYNFTDEDSGYPRMRDFIRGLFPKDNPANLDLQNRFGTTNVLQSLSLASDSDILKNGPSEKLSKLMFKLRKTKKKTLLKIRAEIQSRLVFGIGCVPMILIGIGLGILKKGGHLLTAFGASCIPAAVLIVCIIGGKQVAENAGVTIVSGVSLIWSGLGFLIMIAGVLYYKLTKN